ncbi:abortive infection family protein [Mucilaginibacter celer]|uniref:Abortive infection protein-like C-terminal domain-containing protein n=1 Tax=Mucilaginibacter celer TaxID=2305508 RepID=A0A494VV16_9SPHI|nr:abortive infection family protein [Mucilaginibacter celer]AYL95273.1 hypothetical protein HYN43_008185 [Mucilaginibacter celer]
MNILAVLNPLYKDLLAIGFEGLMSNSDFTRMTNTLDLTDIYAEAFNEAQKVKEDDPFSWLPGVSETEKEILGLFLNKLFCKPLPEFSELLVCLLEATIPLLNYVPDISGIVKDLASMGIGNSFQERITSSWQQHAGDYSKKTTYFYHLVRIRARNNSVNEQHYHLLRKDIMKHHLLHELVPDYISENPHMDGFWQFIKGQGGYREREAFIDATFEPLLTASQQILNVTQEHLFTKANPHVDMAFINQDWRKALNRLKDDPAAAITSARSLVETVCKYILDKSLVEYDDGMDLPNLYRLTAKQLNLSPEAHTEPIFRQILSGCVSIVTGLGSLRNKHSDAHGKRITNVKPSARHAELAVNISGSVCSFLLQTYEFRREENIVDVHS